MKGKNKQTTKKVTTNQDKKISFGEGLRKIIKAGKMPSKK